MANFRGYYWRECDSIPLLEAYQRNRCLWHPRHMYYRVNDYRHLAYDNVRKEMKIPNLTVEDVRVRIKSLRSQYYSERKKVLKYASAGKPYEPGQVWYKRADQFLRGIEGRKRMINKSDAMKPIKIAPYKPKENKDNQCSAEVVEDSADTIIIKDEFHYFGKAVAVQMDKIPLSIALGLKKDIESLVKCFEDTVAKEKRKRERNISITIKKKPQILATYSAHKSYSKASHRAQNETKQGEAEKTDTELEIGKKYIESEETENTLAGTNEIETKPEVPREETSDSGEEVFYIITTEDDDPVVSDVEVNVKAEPVDSMVDEITIKGEVATEQEMMIEEGVKEEVPEKNETNVVKTGRAKRKRRRRY